MLTLSLYPQGDLNYRLEYGHTMEKASKSKEVFDEMVQLANNNQFADLFQYDQVKLRIDLCVCSFPSSCIALARARGRASVLGLQ